MTVWRFAFHFPAGPGCLHTQWVGPLPLCSISEAAGWASPKAVWLLAIAALLYCCCRYAYGPSRIEGGSCIRAASWAWWSDALRSLPEFAIALHVGTDKPGRKCSFMLVRLILRLRTHCKSSGASQWLFHATQPAGLHAWM